VLSQADRTEVRDAYPELAAAFRERFGVELHLVSAASRFQLDELLRTIAQRLPPRTAAPQPVSAADDANDAEAAPGASAPVSSPEAGPRDEH
jgi:hypothetical protein